MPQFVLSKSIHNLKQCHVYNEYIIESFLWLFLGMDVLHKAAISIQKIARGRISRVLVAKLLSKKKKGSKGKKGGKKAKK